MSNLVAIVGRPNVGKSTFFNRLVGGRQAIVDEVAGVTRDRQYGKSLWNGIEFNVVDTGGYAVNTEDIFEAEIRKQVMAAISEADVIVFMVDVTSGITDFDDTVAGILRKSKKKIFLVANKVDNNERIADSGEFYAFGLGEVYCISSANGSGTGEVLDDIVKEFKDNPPLETLELPRFAVVGKPNVGKSSLVNALLGEDRSIVTPIAGTTRDSIYTRFNSFGFDFYLVDTAGVRKKGKVHEDLEFYSVMRAIRAIENCDVCLLMIDAEEGFTAQDVNIFSLAEKNNKGVVIIVNKWDLVEKDHKSAKAYEDTIRLKLEPFTDVPIIFTSVQERQRVIKALEMAVKVYENRTKKIKTSVLNDHMLKVIEHTPPPALKGKHIKIKFITQLPTYYPSFVFFCNLPQYVKDPYYRFIENKMREQYDFHGVPIKIYFRKK